MLTTSCKMAPHHVANRSVKAQGRSVCQWNWVFPGLLASLATVWIASSENLLAADDLEPNSEPDEAAVVDHDQMVFFESKVRPLLVERCWSCHGEEAQKGGLRLDSHAAILFGGDSGEAIVAGDADASLMIEAVRYESYEMPPAGKLPDSEIAILENWVQMGAPWPGAGAEPGVGPEPRTEASRFSEADFAWWAIQPVHDPIVPEPKSDQGKTWVKGDIDRFVLDKMVEHGLAPAPQADRATLIRRLYFDLVGLPPSPAQIDAFVHDPSDDAYEQLVDRLLESPEYGERWARHWLDLVRYADSDGYRADHYRPQAWRYRDYVIDSLNQDKPYDQFVREQIAGDELYPGNPEALVATGYLRNGIYEYNIRDAIGQWNVILNEVTDTTGDVFLGLGMQCARCHDHKFDPILQTDYFQLRAYFEPLAWRDDLVIATSEQRAEFEKQNSVWLEQTKELRKEIAAIEADYKKSASDKAIGRFPANIQAMFAKRREERTPFEQQIVELAYRQVIFEYDRLDGMIKGEPKDRLLELRRELAQFDHIKPEPLPTAMAATDVGPEAPPTIIPKRRKQVQPGTLALLEAKQNAESAQVAQLNGRVAAEEHLVRAVKLADEIGQAAESPEPDTELGSEQESSLPGLPSTGRRSELAQWITSPDNPLSVRVIVNRVWQYHFGKGLAANSSDFGTLGGEPSHPELLDYLAVRFLENGWRLKPLHRMMVTSATYQQASAHPQYDIFRSIDPGNDWYWRFDSKRLDAEQIRDVLLAVTGQLDPTRGGPGSLGDQSRRSIYTRVMRNSRDPLLDVFDLPMFFSSSASRDTTTSPIQSLHLFNSPSMLQLARSLAARIDQQNPEDQQQQITYAWKLVYGRAPRPEEMEQAVAFLNRQTGLLREERESSARVLHETSQMPYRDGQSVLFKPEDAETVLQVSAGEALAVDDFTFETYFQVRSIYDSGAVRTIAASGSGNLATTGWAFGVTGKGSLRKPQTLVIQLFGPSQSKPHEITEAALFSDQHVELNTPYYAGLSVRFAGEDQPGEVTFYLKDLSDDEKPMLVARREHSVTGIELAPDSTSLPRSLRIGGRGSDSSGTFDGLIDDIRLSGEVLTDNELLVVQEAVKPSTVGYWRFESVPGFLNDSGPHALNLLSDQSTGTQMDPEDQALIDLCHVLLNSNSFLYVY